MINDLYSSMANCFDNYVTNSCHSYRITKKINRLKCQNHNLYFSIYKRTILVFQSRKDEIKDKIKINPLDSWKTSLMLHKIISADDKESAINHKQQL